MTPAPYSRDHADTAEPVTLALDGEQRRGLDQHLRLLLDDQVQKLSIEAVTTLEPEALLHVLGDAVALVETVRQIDDQTITAPAGQLAAWIDCAAAEAQEAAADYEHPDDVARYERRAQAMRDLGGDLDALVGAMA